MWVFIGGIWGLWRCLCGGGGGGGCGGGHHGGGREGRGGEGISNGNGTMLYCTLVLSDDDG